MKKRAKEVERKRKSRGMEEEKKRKGSGKEEERKKIKRKRCGKEDGIRREDGELNGER